MKILEWFDKMQEPYQTLAIEAFNSPAGHLQGKEDEYQYLSDALWFAFSFNSTPQGWDYWHTYWHTLIKLGL